MSGKGVWSFYDPETGIVTGRRFRGLARSLGANTPAGLKAIEGYIDGRTQRVDVDTGEVIAYQAPPDPRQKSDRAQARIVALERRVIRPMRELLLDPQNAEARRRLQAIEAEISELRNNLQEASQ